MRYVSVFKCSFVRTPRPLGQRLVQHLLSFPTASTVLDPTAGEGDLLFPTLGIPGVRQFGVEIDAKRAAVARETLGAQALILTAPFEGVDVPARSMSAVLVHPPRYLQTGLMGAYRIVVDAGESLLPGGVMVAILSARLEWHPYLINHWCQWYEQVRVWKLPNRTSPEDELAFEDFLQICVVGVRRAEPVAVDPTERRRLRGYCWHTREMEERTGWESDTPPPDLPTEAIPEPYAVPFCQDIPQLVIKGEDRA